MGERCASALQSGMQSSLSGEVSSVLSCFLYLQQNTTSSTVCGLFAGTSNHSPFILSAGSDQRIRYWDLNSINWLTGSGGDVKAPAMKVDDRCAETRVSTNCAVLVPAARELSPDVYYE